MICNKCKQKLPDDSEFCQYCGSKIEHAETVEAPGITPDEAINAVLRIQAEATIEAMRANAASQPNDERDDDFGLVPEKPIFTLAFKSVDGEEEYLDKLCAESGEKILYTRRGSMSVEGIHGMIDIYDTFLPSGQPYKTIYINMYGAKASKSAPQGFKFATTTVVQPARTIKPKAGRVKKTINKKLWAIAVSATLSFVIILVLLPTLIIPSVKYNHAKNLLESGDYELAYSAFLMLDGFSDSKDMLNECRYVQAIKYRDAGDYELANKIFESLGNYRDSEILIHKHDYRVLTRTEATCTQAGSEILQCSVCKDSYTNYLEASHQYDVNQTIDATCTSTGSTEYSCSVCHDTYSETISKKSHNFSAATCASPKKCLTCGLTEGNPLGHTSTLICTRCGTCTFETLRFSGSGPSSITNIDLPVGKYNILFTHNGSSNFIVRFTGGIYSNTLVVNSIGTVSYVYQVTSSYTNSGLIENGYFNITNANGAWTITIEAIGN